MKQPQTTRIIPLILVLALSLVSLQTQARDSLEALRTDLNAAVIKITEQQTLINGLESKNTAQQIQIYALQGQTDLSQGLYKVGDTGPAGGIVFIVFGNDGSHGLEAAPVDQNNAHWGCYGLIISDTYDFGGLHNTQNILAACDQSGIAAEIADNYELNGYTDWYLPSKDELSAMYTSKHLLHMEYGYWSSTESDSSYAWTQDFLAGLQGVFAKDGMLRVRAIRAF